MNWKYSYIGDKNLVPCKVFDNGQFTYFKFKEDDLSHLPSVYTVDNSFSQSAEQSLQQDGKISPTLTTYQGKPIIVFVAKDLNFQAAMKEVNPKLNIF